MPIEGKKARDHKASTSRLPKVERQRLLMDEALPWFLSMGYADTTLEGLATATGMSVGALKKAFPDKASLFASLFTPFYQSIGTELTFQSPEGSIDFPAALHAFGQRFLHTAKRESSAFTLLVRAMLRPTDPEERATATACLDHLIHWVTQLLDAGQQAGIFRRMATVEVIAADLIRFLMGLALIPNPPREKIDDHPPAILETWLHGVLKTDV